MSTYDAELLDAARRLLTRRSGQRGKLPTARVRRSISTTYYALFHFLLDEVGARVIGTHHDLRRRRRIAVRTISHKACKITLDKFRGAKVDDSIADFVRPRGAVVGEVAPPQFARDLANVFADAQAKRLDADYDLSANLSEADARLLRTRVRRCVAAWRAANAVADKDFKQAICVLILLKGQLRVDA